MKTVRNVQRSIFLHELRNHMDIMRSGTRRAELVTSAEEYLREGLSESECKELLVMDGFNGDMVKSCVDDLCKSSEISEDEEPRWGFELEDSHGNIISNADIGMVITAGNRTEAWEKVEATMSLKDPTERLLRVFKVR